MVDSWEQQKAEKDFLQTALNGLFRDMSKGWSFDVQPPGIKATSDLAGVSKHWMPSVVCMKRIPSQEELFYAEYAWSTYL